MGGVVEVWDGLFLDACVDAHGIPEEDRATWGDFVVVVSKAGVVDVAWVRLMWASLVYIPSGQ